MGLAEEEGIDLVQGAKDFPDETWEATARREVMEETGIDCAIGQLTDWNLENVYDIYPRWLHRYAPGITRNTEHVFGLCVPEGTAVIRSMPNTPASVGRGITVAVGNAHVAPAQRQACDGLLRAVGEVAWADDEALKAKPNDRLATAERGQAAYQMWLQSGNAALAG